MSKRYTNRPKSNQQSNFGMIKKKQNTKILHPQQGIKYR